jgi:hypothetical protein
VSEYISRLSSLTGDGTDTLRRLTKYRTYRNRLAHEVGALSSLSEITREDVKWISRFIKKIRAKKDPISCYELDRKKRSFGYKFKRILIAALLAAILIIATIIYASLK